MASVTESISCETDRIRERGRRTCEALDSLKGDSYRLRGKDLDTRIGAKPAQIG